MDANQRKLQMSAASARACVYVHVGACVASIEQILTPASLRAQVGGEPPMYAKRGCATDVRVCVRVCVYVYVYMYACVKGTCWFR